MDKNKTGQIFSAREKVKLIGVAAASAVLGVTLAANPFMIGYNLGVKYGPEPEPITLSFNEVVEKHTQKAACNVLSEEYGVIGKGCPQAKPSP